MPNRKKEFLVTSRWRKIDQHHHKRVGTDHKCPPHIWCLHNEYAEANWITNIVDSYYYCVVCGDKSKNRPRTGYFFLDRKTIVEKGNNLDVHKETILGLKLPIDFKALEKSSALRKRRGKKLVVTWKEIGRDHYQGNHRCPPHIWFETGASLDEEKSFKPHYKCSGCGEERDEKPIDGYYDSEVINIYKNKRGNVLRRA